MDMEVVVAVPARVGMVFPWYCNGYFGDSYRPKRVEAIGHDWIVVREIETGTALFADVPPDKLDELAERWSEEKDPYQESTA